MSGQVAVHPVAQDDDVPARTARLAADRDHRAPWDPLPPECPCTAGRRQDHGLFPLLHAPGMR